ncbi:hypothetical protein [Persicobacter diffluens]|uniref:Uncharacterized protein n=1 Tax=Persicobacter diffluens TaxID=981 RepID=A0AAN5ALE9_9BACT|nr:hypothetical protein PEDI_19280 [Persicobacter diffluens]
MELNISGMECKMVRKHLPGFAKLLGGNQGFRESGIYNKMFVSVFDRWLSEGEIHNKIFIDEHFEEVIKRRKRFREFITEVNSGTILYSWRYKRHNRLHIQKPESIKDVLRKCDFDRLWSHSGERYSFLLPDYGAVYEEGWDWTNIIWFLDVGKTGPLIEAAKKSGLYILK